MGYDAFMFNKNVAPNKPLGHLKVWGFNLQRILLGWFLIAFCQQQVWLCLYNASINTDYEINTENTSRFNSAHP